MEMNKKTYIQPNTIVMLMETVCLTTTSLETDTKESNGVSNEEDVLARKNFNIWDDEE